MDVLTECRSRAGLAECDNSGLLRQMLRIRLFEQKALAEFSRGLLFGTTHTCIGQEADAAGVASALQPSDLVVSNHRGHGHYLAAGGDMRELAAELMGKATGVCGGWGGSQHLQTGGFYSNGVLGGMVPCAAGMAAAEKAKRQGNIVVLFIGDGALGEGVVYESINIASLWRLPLLFVVENNQYAQTTPLRLGVAGSIQARFEAFGVEAQELKTTDVLEIYLAAQAIVDQIRSTMRPRALILETYRLAAHSKGDDTRDPAEVEHHWQFDPIVLHGYRVPERERDNIRVQCAQEVESAFLEAEHAPFPDVAEAGRNSLRGLR